MSATLRTPNSDLNLGTLSQPGVASAFDQFAHVPQSMKILPNWVNWRLEERSGKMTKIPYDPKTGKPAKANNSTTWSDFRTAVDAADPFTDNNYDGIGFEFGESWENNSGHVGIDLDNVINADGSIDSYALEIKKAVGTAFNETSPSGTGQHVIVRGTLPDSVKPQQGKHISAKKAGCDKYGVEIYGGGHFFTITGETLPESSQDLPIVDLTLAYFLILQFADEKFKRAWCGDASDYENDESDRDLGLLGMIRNRLKTTDRETLVRYFNASVPGRREKWLSEKLHGAFTYRDLTLNKLLSGSKSDSPTAYGVPPADPNFAGHLKNPAIVRDSAAPVASQIQDIVIADMPDSVLVGRLGEIFDKYMRKFFPVGFGWLSLVTVAGALIQIPPEHIRTNTYSGLVGDPGVGKTQCIEWAQKLLGLIAPILEKVMAGSSEGLFTRLQNAAGASRLLSVDELSHLLAKSKIDNASFPYVLNRAYYDSLFTMVAARSRQIDFNCNLSILGGVVEGNFENSFGAASIGGLYDRFGFAQCPTGYQYDFRPCEYSKVLGDVWEPVKVDIDPQVWEAKSEYVKKLQVTPRLFEIGLRVAVICAAIDRRSMLRVSDLEPVLPFVQYQANTRKVLQPNPGENVDGILAAKFLNYIERYGAKGEWLDVRTMLREVHSYRYGVGNQRVLDGLDRAGEIDQHGRGVAGQKQLIRRRGVPQ
jgi:hypothetical protein